METKLKLLLFLPQIKFLTKDWYMTLAAAKYSVILEVNNEHTKVRRIEPLPKWLLHSPTNKFLLIWNISADLVEAHGADGGQERLPLSERVIQRFSTYGSIASVWILHPGNELPKELQCYAKNHKELGQNLCAVVKFGNLEAVRKAYCTLKAEKEKSSGEGMCAAILGFQSMHNFTEIKLLTKRHKPGKFQENPVVTLEDLAQDKPPPPADLEQALSPQTHQKELSPPELEGCLRAAREEAVEVFVEVQDNSKQSTSEQISTSCNEQVLSGLHQRYSAMSCSGECERKNYQSPWVLSRKKMAARNPTIAGHLNTSGLKQRVMRQPFGPDCTKGFQGRGALLSQNTGRAVGELFSNV